MSTRPSARRDPDLVGWPRPWRWHHPACRATAGRDTWADALRDCLHHLRMCPGHD